MISKPHSFAELWVVHQLASPVMPVSMHTVYYKRYTLANVGREYGELSTSQAKATKVTKVMKVTKKVM
jgi:hypothetical protein